jgi:hypothetical protein
MVALLFDELVKNHISVHFKKTFNNYVYVHTVHFLQFIICGAVKTVKYMVEDR